MKNEHSASGTREQGQTAGRSLRLVRYITCDEHQNCEGNHGDGDVNLLRGLLADPALGLDRPRLGLINPLVHGRASAAGRARGDELR